MSIPPHRTAGESGHIEDHNAIADVLTGHDDDIADTQLELSAHQTDADPHGDRAYTDQAISDAIGDLPDPPVTSVNGKTGSVDLVADDVGAATPGGVESLIGQLEGDIGNQLDEKLDSSVVGEPNGVAPLDGDGLIPEESIPSLTGSNKVIVSEDVPEDPAEGDIWINLSDQSLDPSPLMPGIYKTEYEGPGTPPYSSLQPAGEWVPIPDMDPIVFTTGATGHTEISIFFNLTNNASDTSTIHLSFGLSGEGVDHESGWYYGAYQSSREASTTVGVDIFSSHTIDLPPQTEVTLSPTWRLSSLPDETSQNSGSGTRRFTVAESRDNHYRVKAW